MNPYDWEFKKTCPACNRGNVRSPENPKKDENGDDYEQECVDCGFQWQAADRDWPDHYELRDSSIREILVEWGKKKNETA